MRTLLVVLFTISLIGAAVESSISPIVRGICALLALGTIVILGADALVNGKILGKKTGYHW